MILLKEDILSGRQTKEQSYNDIWAGLYNCKRPPLARVRFGGILG
jgi:hypothetical protein